MDTHKSNEDSDRRFFFLPIEAYGGYNDTKPAKRKVKEKGWGGWKKERQQRKQKRNCAVSTKTRTITTFSVTQRTHRERERKKSEESQWKSKSTRNPYTKWRAHGWHSRVNNLSNRGCRIKLCNGNIHMRYINFSSFSMLMQSVWSTNRWIFSFFRNNCQQNRRTWTWKHFVYNKLRYVHTNICIDHDSIM